MHNTLTKKKPVAASLASLASFRVFWEMVANTPPVLQQALILSKIINNTFLIHVKMKVSKLTKFYGTENAQLAMLAYFWLLLHSCLQLFMLR